MRGEPLFLFLLALVLEPLSFVFVHVPPPAVRASARGMPPQTLLRMSRAVPLKMRSLSTAGMSSASMLETARSIEPRRCG
jgi:hypothetical protein